MNAKLPKNWELIKAYYGYPRQRLGWRNVIEFTGRVDVGWLLRCKKCGLYFWDAEKAREHKHET